MSMRAALRLLLLAVMLLAPLGRIGVAQAMAAPAEAPAAMAGHCAGMPAPAGHGGRHGDAPQQGDEGKAVDCMIACAAMTETPAAFLAPPLAPAAMAGAPLPVSLTGIRPEADPPPPRFS